MRLPLRAGVRSAIGLKNKFILLIASLFIGSHIILGAIQFYLFQNEQWSLINNRIETTATLLLKSDLSKDDLDDVEFARTLIERSIDSQPFNLFIRIFSDSLQLLYQTGESFSAPFPKDANQRWTTYKHTNESVIRTLVLPLPRNRSDKQRYLEVGMVIDNDLIGTKHIKNIIIILIFIFVATALILTQILVRSFLTPLKVMSNIIKDLSRSIGERTFDVTKRGLAIPNNLHSREFEELILELESLSNAIRLRFKDTRFWTAQMAHELRTPLTIITNRIEQLVPVIDSKERHRLKDITDELSYLKELLSAFMNWVEASQTLAISSNLNAININQIVTDILNLYKNEAEVQAQNDLKVICNIFFIKQLISNIIDNAIKYSIDNQIKINIINTELVISNRGPNFPDDVRERLGLPFNYLKSNKKGFGLGLAWVKMICDHYDIKMKIISDPDLDGLSQTSIALDFSSLILLPESN